MAHVGATLVVARFRAGTRPAHTKSFFECATELAGYAPAPFTLAKLLPEKGFNS